MIVAYYIPHNDGIFAGVIGEPGHHVDLVDLYEVDGMIATFDDQTQALVWLQEQFRLGGHDQEAPILDGLQEPAGREPDPER